MQATFLMRFYVASLVAASTAFALDPIPQDSGFSGFVMPGVGAINYKSNLVADVPAMNVGDRVTGSLDSSPDSTSSAMGVVNFEVAYTIASTRTQFTLGNQLEDIARMNIGQQLAVKQELPDQSIVSAGLLFSSIPTEVWEDPYVANAPRSATDRGSAGLRLVYDRILGSNFEVRYSLRSIDIDNERSGLTGVLGLTPAQASQLRRDGSEHHLDVSHRFVFDRRHILTPSLTFFREDRDGEAMSQTGADLQLTYIYLGRPVTVVLNGMIGLSENDEANPIYGRTQETDRFGANAQLFYRNPFGWKPFGHEHFAVFVSGTFFRADANINFYDTQVLLGVGGILVRF